MTSPTPEGQRVAELFAWMEEDRERRVPCPRCRVDTRYYGCFCFEPLPAPPTASGREGERG